ncbi:MAG: immunoglobulin domain-containing protein [Phaeodactylibacter sp.]|uniref:immunoglobulin domain-containing protein n=1 Tax=Phaeodactylibacter sp. TaxID=1940289 RepID=UPI0032ECD524
MKYIITAALLMLGWTAQAKIEITTMVDCACEGISQQAFAVIAEGSAGPFQFYWRGPEGYTSREKEPGDIELPGAYRLSILNSYGCVFKYHVELAACPGPSFDFEIEPNATDKPGQLSVIVTGSDNYISYEWYKEDDTLLPQKGKYLKKAPSGIYYLVVINERGCRFTSPTVKVPDW